MRFLTLLFIALLFVVGCQPLTVNKATEVTVDSVLYLSGEVDLAEKRGWISNETEDELQNRLIDALKVLRSGYTLTDGVPGCDDGLSRQECAQQIMAEVEWKLRENSP